LRDTITPFFTKHRLKHLLSAFPNFTERIEQVVERCLQEIPPKLREKV
jgi:hypothetical protein